MFAYVVRRVFIGVIMLLVMSLVTFMLFFSALDPGRYLCGKNCSPELQAQTEKALGYDKPAVVQWVDFVQGIFTGRSYPEDPEIAKKAPDLISECPAPCFGYSVVNTKTVSSEISEAFPITASLALAAVIMWLIGGIAFGIVAALKRGTIIDRGLVGVALVLYAFPTFFIGLFLLRFVAIKWELVPVPEYTPIAEGGIGGWISSLFLPGLTLAVFYMAGYVRMTRAFMLESLSEDYIRTARAKGLPGRQVVFKHGFRATITPLVTMVGLDFAALLGGAIITESVFNYNGLGKLAVDANLNFDLPTLVGLVILLGTFVIFANIIVDVLYAVIDPRVRVG
jgi:peptide/nickel transport system permease protein